MLKIEKFNTVEAIKMKKEPSIIFLFNFHQTVYNIQ